VDDCESADWEEIDASKDVKGNRVPIPVDTVVADAGAALDIATGQKLHTCRP
jgi:hypothetical protein